MSEVDSGFDGQTHNVNSLYEQVGKYFRSLDDKAKELATPVVLPFVNHLRDGKKAALFAAELLPSISSPAAKVDLLRTASRVIDSDQGDNHISFRKLRALHDIQQYSLKLVANRGAHRTRTLTVSSVNDCSISVACRGVEENLFEVFAEAVADLIKKSAKADVHLRDVITLAQKFEYTASKVSSDYGRHLHRLYHTAVHQTPGISRYELAQSIADLGTLNLAEGVKGQAVGQAIRTLAEILVQITPSGGVLIDSLRLVARIAKSPEVLLQSAEDFDIALRRRAAHVLPVLLTVELMLALNPSLIQFQKSVREVLSTEKSIALITEKLNEIGSISALLTLARPSGEFFQRKDASILRSFVRLDEKQARRFFVQDDTEDAYRKEQLKKYPFLKSQYEQDKAGNYPSNNSAIAFGGLSMPGDISSLLSGIIEAEESLGSSEKPPPVPRPEQPLEVTESIQLIAPADRFARLWGRIADVYLGFGAFLFESKRLPDGQPSSLSQCGLDLGKLSFLNAKLHDSFPGRGVVIDSLDILRVFSHDLENQSDPFHEYSLAWPTLGKHIAGLPETKFIFARGFIGVIPGEGAEEKILLMGKEISYAMVIFNSHFGNPGNQVAYLIPKDLLERYLENRTIVADDYVGFDTERGSAHDLARPEDFMKLSGGEYILNIGNPSYIFGGIVGDSFEPWQKFLDKFAAHNQKIKDWDQWFWRGNRDFKTEDGRKVSFTYKDEWILHSEATRLLEEQENLLDSEKSRDNTVDAAVIQTTHALLDRFDLFRIVLANWHKGLTAAQQDGSLEGQEPDDQDNEPALNRQGTRMLAQARAFHSLRSEGVNDKNAFPLLVIVDTFASMEAPNLRGPNQYYLDTFDMVMHTPQGVVQFSAEAEFDDELFWLEKIIPLADDVDGKFNDIRFYNRQSVLF